jgi:hypothetical protein
LEQDEEQEEEQKEDEEKEEEQDEEAARVPENQKTVNLVLRMSNTKRELNRLRSGKKNCPQANVFKIKIVCQSVKSNF